jgi:succinoglycan biosynthesis protein ExoA
MIDPQNPPRVSVVIPCRNEAAHVGALLDALRAQDAPVHEVIVVDSASTDATLEIVRRFQGAGCGWPLRILTSLPRGAAAAMNLGVGAADGDVIVRLDGHSIPRPDYVRRALQRLQEEGTGVVGGVWDVVPGAETPIARAIAAALSHRLGTGGAAYRDSTGVSEAAAVDTVPYGCYRKTLWQELDGYDRRPLSEDYLFNYRTRRLGWRVVLDPAVRCTYYARATFARLAAQYFKYGWHKAELLRHFPGAIRLRQIVPGGFTATLLILGVLGFVVEGAWRIALGVAGLYGAAITISAVQIAGSHRNWTSLPAYMVAFSLMHLAWGLGACINVVTFGRWPYRNASQRACEEPKTSPELL